MRIIGGSLRGKKLQSVRGAAVRPTADRLRESIFSILFSRVRDAVVLDLFAGTGALGLESISRGAEFAVFIDHSRDAVSAIARNTKSCNLELQTKIIRWNIAANLNCIRSHRPAFDLVFMDPPYNRNLVRPALFNLQRSDCLEKGAVVVVEHAAAEPIPEDLPALKIDDQRKYGKTLVSFLGYVL